MGLEKITFVSTDIVDSTGIKERHALNDVKKTFDAYHDFLDSDIKSWLGEVWTISGDGIDFFFKGDNSEQNALGCTYSILRYLAVFNLFESAIDENIEVRIAIGSPVLELKTKDYGKISDPQIDKICKAQKDVVKSNQILILKSTYQNIQPKLRSMFSEFIHNREVMFLFNADSSQEETIFEESVLNLGSIENVSSSAIDIPVKKPITPDLHFSAVIKLAALEQKFTIYYLFTTDKNESKWIGYYKGDRNSTDYRIKNEFTKALKIFDTRHVIIIDSLNHAITERFPNLEGKPILVDRIRFRADDAYQVPVKYYYGLFEKKF